MVCDFSHLRPGDNVWFTSTDPEQCCMSCASPITFTEVPAIYRGHTDYNGVTVDAFTLTDPFRCGGCGDLITTAAVFCDGPIPFGIEIAEVEEVEQYTGG